MNGSERILSRIRTDCDESVRKIETHAQHEHDRIIADAQHRADTQAAAVAEKTAQKRAQLETSSQSRAQLARRNALLKQRRKEIDTTVEELEAYLLGLGDNEYFEASACPKTSPSAWRRQAWTLPSAKRLRTSPAASSSNAATWKKIWNLPPLSAPDATKSKI